ncbi:hypothetical protein PTSG_01300 [Salpingoeca rosetta]|uniref:Uncharacterized protein n=1 Tax=Salpingoeca rosetta (strain ATCC 50818 / BSB-021) TaxID=946362 RepID=F2TZY2_SALR5|nr:uncharacterized protein PTSG_01300 [Salpingoeca rosetta]EGD80710.1 hypothetical protein PTSG_01300 [Salpingoeca rosetta]|eukprot:XP_004997271.1 hypothetical protein PTSG_01300 [Salpingoeca rosetta]
MVSVLQRSAAAVLLHVSLLAAALVRVSALSLVYLAALFSLLLLPLQFSKQAYRIVLFLRVFAPVVCLAQLAFQIYLGSQKPYARKLDHDSVLASTLAQIGFVRFDVIWHTVLRFLAPDIVVALVALAVPRPLNPQAYFTLFPEEGTGRLTALWVAISDTGIWMLLGTFVLTCCNAAAPAVLFYLVYLSLIAAFVFASLKKWVARCRPLLSAVLTLYLAATYVFQLPFVYQAMEPSADVLGLISYVEQRPPAYHASPVLRLNDLAWPLWILLVAQILTLYLVTAPFRRFRRAQTITTRPSLLEPLLGGSDEEQQHFNPLGSRDMRNDFAVHKRSRSAHRSHGHVDEVDEVDDDDGFGYHDDAAAAADDDDDDDVLGDEGDDVEQYDDDDVVVDGDTLGDDSKNGPSFMSHLWTQAMTSITTTAATLLRPVVKVCVNQSWIVTLVALYTWALAFPSWFGVVMIAWSLVAVYPETPTLFFRSSFVLIVFGGVITLLNLLFFIHPDIIPDKDVAEQLGLHEHASLERITGTIAAKLLFMFVFALTARAFVKTPWFQRQLRSTAHTHGSSGSTGGDSSPTSTTATTALLSDRRTTTRAAGGARDDHHAHRDQQLRRRGRVNDSDDAEDDDDDDNGDDGGRGGYSYHGYSGVGDGDGVGGRGSQAYANMDGGDDGKHTAVTPMVSPSPSSPSSSSWWKAKLKHALSSCADALLFVWDLCLRYAYLLTVLIVYVASLNEVTVFNAAYLVILIAFLGFPRLREEYWVWLLLYCTAVILVNYLWGFPSVRTSDSTVESLLGLDPAIHHHIWRDLRWHIAILGLSLIQLLAYRLIPSTRVSQPPALPPCDHDTSSADGNMDAHHRTQATRKVAPQPYSHALPSPPSPTAPAAASITEPLLAHDASHAALVRGDEEGVHAPPSFTKTHRVGTGTGDREHTNTNGDGGGGDGPRVIRWLRNTDRWLELQAKRYWAFVVCLALFLGGILGTVTFMRLGYLALLTVQLLLFELGQHAVMRKVWYIVLLYAGVVLVAKYMYQFEDLRPRLNRAFGEKLLEDAGFRVMNSQRRLFIYLLPATLTLVAAVIQTRVQTSERSLFEGPMFPSRTILQKAAVGFLRMCALHVEQVVIGLALASALRPTPEGMDIITILLIGLVMLIPKSKRVLHFLLLAWMAAMALAKLAYQLHEVKLHINETELSWFGLHPIHGTKETPLALVQWEIYVMLSSICRRVLRDVRGRLWGDDNTRGQRCFFDEPPPRPESIERMAESRTSTSGSTSDGDGDDDAAAVESVPLVESTNTSGVFGGGVVPEEPRVWTMDAVSTGLKFVINHYFELFGMYLVLVLALVAALVRLNVVSLFYLVVVGVLAVRRNTITHGAWRTILIVQAILFLYLYASALGLPDNVEYPWDGVASRHYALRVVLRWVYLPPNHPGHESTHEPNNGIIPRAPLGWSTPEALAPRLKEQILRHKQRTATRVELAKRFIQRLSEYKRKDSTHAYRERELALWFLRRRDASTLLSQSLTAPDEDYPEDTSGKDDASGDGVAGDQGKHEGASAPTSAAAPRVASTHDLPPTPVATTTTDDTSGAIDAHAYGGDGDLDVDLQPDPEEEVVLMTHPPEQQDGGAASAAQQPDTTAPRRQQQQQKSEDGSKEKDAPKPPLLSRLRVWIITTWRSGLKALQTQLHEANHVFEPLWRDDWTSSSSLSPSSPGCARFDEDEPPPSASKPPPSLSTELYRFWSTHTHVPCYLLLIINVLVESSFLAVLLPLFYFLWGGLVRPFPSIVFWKALTFYSIGTILLKLAFQFEFWGQFNAPAHSECRQSFFNDGCMDFPRFLGIWRYADTPEFLVDLLPDMLLLLSLFVHRVNLRSLGMWQPKVWPDMDMKPATTRQQRKKDKQAQDAIASGGSEHKAHALVRSRTPSTAVTTAEVLHMDGDTTATEPHFHHEHADVSQHSRTRTSTLSSLRSRRSASASSILSGASTHDDGWAHDRDDTDHHRHHHRRRHRRRHRRGSAASGGTSLLHRFTKGLRDILDDSLAAPRDYYIPSFLVEFLSFIVICFGWSGFRRREQFAVSTSSIIQDNNIPSGLLLYMLMQFLFIIVDRALYLTRNVRGKLIFHCLVALLVHFLVFYWIPSTTRRSFRENSVIIVLYILKVVYLFLSAAQIRATFPLSVQRNSLTRHSTLFGFVVFQVYRAIPFMHELRMLLDWSCTATTLHLNDWYRVEDINGQLFSNQYTIKSEKKDGRRWGEKQPLMQKLATGVSLVAVLVIVLWFPLLIMSLINNRAEPNVPNRVEISLSVNSFEPIFVMDTVPTLPSIAAEDYAELESVDPSGFVNSFRQSDVQRVLLSPQSKSVWTISPSSRARLLTTLRDNTTDVVLEFTVRFTRDVRDGVAQVSTETRTTTILPEEPTRLQLLEALNTSNARVHLPFVYASTFHLSHEDMPRPQSALPDSLRDLLVNCTLFRQIDGTHEWWTMLQSSPHVASATDNRNISHSKYPASQWLEIVTFNDRVVPESLSFISSYGIVGLYVSVVLVIGRFIRLSVDNVSHKIIFEKMPQVLAVRSVLDALYLSREHGELWTEESIFQLLLRLYRSPEALLVWTDEQLLHEYEQQRAQSTPSTASSSS